MKRRSMTMINPLNLPGGCGVPSDFFLTSSIVPTMRKCSTTGLALALNLKGAATVSRTQRPSESSAPQKTSSDSVDQYQDCELQPGLGFYRALCSIPKTIAKYGLRIPDTYYAGENKLLVFDDSKGYIARVETVLDDAYKRRLEHEARAHNGQPDEPAYVFCKRNVGSSQCYTVTSEVVTWRELEGKIRCMALVEMYIQKYKKHNKGRKLIYRLTYFSNPVKYRKANYVEIMGPPEAVEPEHRRWGYNSDHVVHLYKSYNGLSEFEHTAKKVVQMASIEFGCRLKQLQLDFIKEKETDPKYWFVGLYSFELENETFPKSPSLGVNIMNVREQTAPTKCGLCGEKYKRGQIDKLLPLKLIFETRNHMERRNLIGLFPPMQMPESSALMCTCRVCSLCYLLVVQESALIEAEKQMAIAQSIPVVPNVTVQSYKGTEDPNALFHTGAFATHLLQWRSLLYIIKFSHFHIGAILPSKDYTLDIAMFNNGHTSFPVDFSKMSRKDRRMSILKRQRTMLYNNDGISTLREKVANTSHPNSPRTYSDCISEAEIYVNRMRVNYFFSETRSIDEFINTCYVEFKLINSDSLVVAQARSRIFKDFSLHGQTDVTAEKVFRRIVMYTPKLQMLQLDVLVGLCFDGKVELTSENMVKYRNTDVHYPDDGYIANSALPPEWMEAFLPEKNKMNYLEMTNNLDASKIPYAQTVRSINPRSTRRATIMIATARADSTPGSCRILLSQGSVKGPAMSVASKASSFCTKPCTGTTTAAQSSPKQEAQQSVNFMSMSSISDFRKELIRDVKTAEEGCKKLTVGEALVTKDGGDTCKAELIDSLKQEVGKKCQHSVNNGNDGSKNDVKKKHKKNRTQVKSYLWEMLSPYADKEVITKEFESKMKKGKKRYYVSLKKKPDTAV